MRKTIRNLKEFQENKFQKGKLYRFIFKKNKNGILSFAALWGKNPLCDNFLVSKENDGVFLCVGIYEQCNSFRRKYMSYDFLGPDGEIYLLDDSIMNVKYFDKITINIL